MRDNIALNCTTIASAGGRAAAQAFVWGETDVSELAPEWRTPDVIVAADVVYRRELFQPLLHALKSLGAMPDHPPFAAWRSGSAVNVLKHHRPDREEPFKYTCAPDVNLDNLGDSVLTFRWQS